MIVAQIDVYSHFFKVSKIQPIFYHSVMTTSFRELLQTNFVKIRGRVQKQNHKIYMARSQDKSEYRYHIHYLERFKQLMKGARINDKEVTWIEHPLYEPADMSAKMPGVELRDYQIDAHDYVVDTGVSKLVSIYTGGGKTFTALKIGETIGKRTLIMVLARYLQKWIEDVEGAYGKSAKIAVLKGTSSIINLVLMAKEGKPIPDVIIVSTTTMQNYIREWEQHQGKELEGMIAPEELYETLGIGYRIIDEAHQHFHAVFKNDLYTHCPKCVYLTATLDTNDRFMNFIYYLMWPLDMRTKQLTRPAYDNTIAVRYHHYRPDNVRYMGQQGYSHSRYEQSIWKHVPSRCQYLDMIGDFVETYFVPLYEPGKKMLIFCSLVDTCIDVAHYLNDRFKDKHWKISKFTAEDPKSVIDTNDITVSTLGKSGTALDISGLIVCLMTVALSEPKANIQAKGRLRDLSKKPGFEHITPIFGYLVGSDIERHNIYHNEKKKLFSPITLDYREDMTSYVIGEPMMEYVRYGKPQYWDGWKAEKRFR